MSKKRVFVAINLPEQIKERFGEFRNHWQDFPARWVRPENIHLTLYFAGYIEVGNIKEFIEAVKRGVEEARPFPLKISEILYGPNNKKPKMIWAKVKSSKDLLALQANIRRELENLSFRVQKEVWKYNPHITLAKFNSFNLKEWHEDGLPDISTAPEESFMVSSVSVVESKLKRSGAEYFMLQSIPLPK